MPTFRKRSRTAPAGFFAAEAAGLAWLAAADGAAVVDVLAVHDDGIDLDELAAGRPTEQAARRFGADLARMHDAGAESFGAPPAGWDGPHFIGNRRQACRPSTGWGAFYGPQRVAPFAQVARDAGSLTADEHALVQRAVERISGGGLDDADVPARLHGDLWNGNVVWTDGGAVLIDPAAHGGHRETDLAMLALFGLPFLDDVLVGYERQHPLRSGWRDRVAVHQLHPLAVHAAGHGRAYGRALAGAAAATLALP